ARGFVAAARLHADVAVLDDVNAADAVRAGQFIQPRQHLVRSHGFAIYGDDVAVLVDQIKLLRRIWGLLKRDGPLPHGILGRSPGIVQHAALVGDVQGIGVGRIRRAAIGLATYFYAVLFGIGQQALARVEVPFTPRSDDLHVRHQG